MSESLLNVAEAARFLRISTAYIYVLVTKRQISCLRIGRRILFRQAEDLEPFLARHVQRAEAQE